MREFPNCRQAGYVTFENYKKRQMKKIILFLFSFLLFQYSGAQIKTDSIKTALLIVDIQEFYFPSDYSSGLVNAEEASLKAKDVLKVFRDNKQLVVHVRHQSNKGFEIHKNVAPIKGEKIITKHEVNSFFNTDLLKYLENNKINRLIIIGMQTQMCLEGAVRAAHDYGFDCIVIDDACATRNLKFRDKTVKAEDVQTCVLATLSQGGYAKVITSADFKANYKKFLFEGINK